MEIRCYGCMEKHDSSCKACPYCGYMEEAMSEYTISLKCGTILNNCYEVGKVISYDWPYFTYIGWDRALEQKVVIKEYLPHSFSTRLLGTTEVIVYDGNKKEKYLAGLDDFVNRAKLFAGCSPSFCTTKIYDFFEKNNTAYMVTEYVDGDTLQKYIREKGIIPPEKAVIMMLPLMDYLGKAHKKGVIHGDIEPNKIILMKDGIIKLIDFCNEIYVLKMDDGAVVLPEMGYLPKEVYMSQDKLKPDIDIYI